MISSCAARKRTAFLLFAALSAFAVATPTAQAARLPSADSARSYIVVLDDRVAAPAAVAREFGVNATYEYTNALKGFAGRIDAGTVRNLRADSRVVSIELDGVMRASTTQLSATWGLDRVDQRAMPLDTKFNYVATGSGVKAYIVDTGINFSHAEFTGRLLRGTDTVTGFLGTSASTNGEDCNGHGTHVAGTTGGTTYGVAKQVTLVAVRVLGCDGSGTTSGVIKGVDWVTGDHAAGAPAVANMSLSGGASSSLDTAVKNSIADGVTFTLAGGNGNALGIGVDACTISPARVATALTVGATDKTDTKASFSNYGTCLDVFGPGVSITSAWKGSSSATSTISGTSMAAPHVAGVAAQYLQNNRTASPATVGTALTTNATANVVKSAGTGSPNKLIFTNY